MKYWFDNEHKAAFKYAKSMTKIYSKSFYISSLMLPKERRWATFALYGFCRYVDNMIDNPRDRSVEELLAETGFMKQELGIAYKTGESEHPVLKSFIAVAKRYNIPINYPLELLEGVEMDLTRSRYQTFDELYLFCYRVAGVVGLMMTHILGFKDKKAFEYAEKLGIAMQLTNILRDVREDKNMNRIYLPLAELTKFGISESDIHGENMTPKLRRFMKFQIKRAQDYYDYANQGIPLLDQKSQFAIYSASKIYNGILHKIENQNFNPFLGRVFIPQIKKISILFKEILKTRIPLIGRTVL